MPSRDASLPSGSGTPLSKETEVTTLEVYANHFKLNLPKLDVHHYDVQIWSSAEGEEPPEDPRRIPACDKHRIFIRFAHLFLNIRAPVFDGQKSFYSTRPVEDKKEGVRVKSDFCSTTDFYVKIKRVARLNNERCGPGRGTVLVQALDIALRCALSRNRECLGRLLLSPVDEGRTSRDLAREGQALYRGVLTSVRSGEAGTFVNADTLHTVFYKPDSLLNLVQCLLGRPVQRQAKLQERDIQFLNAELKDLKITAKLLPTVSSWNPPQYSKKIRWIMLNTCNSDGARIRKLEQLENGLIGQGKAMGIELSKTNTLQRTGRQRVEDMLQEVKDRDVDFVVIVLENASSELYYPIKYYAETKLGLITQCVAIYKQNKEQNFGSGFCKNVMRKIKAKLGFVDKAMPSKINHFDFENVMVMGADVGHHGPNDAKPSVAAIVGSIDTCASRYVATISLQNEPRVEVIDDMGSMVRRLLDVYWQNNKAAPKAILFYRDGVSEGQYSQVYDRELPCLHAECKKAFPEYPIPKITFVTVQKRHRTRFMRKTPEGSNVPPGTVVDTVITHPSQQEFFMCSHTPMRGTARPAHYHVIRDDNEFDPETLQKITFSLCHMYARCETPVSIPTPVYYAHLTAARASCYLKAHERLTGMNTFNADVVKLTHNLKDRMFFI
ncbi:hypothetical protein HPB49_015225 [Dermacentor silvarum]|uniref:Uncharacterized protein n=1 Tax=Dermacentor silvarum TaxID=543639 RepID=A0ACB8CA11_DERSI|nr:hypothetical protein HPB49_015225 [Dermacentor silvarum]